MGLNKRITSISLIATTSMVVLYMFHRKLYRDNYTIMTWKSKVFGRHLVMKGKQRIEVKPTEYTLKKKQFILLFTIDFSSHWSSPSEDVLTKTLIHIYETLKKYSIEVIFIPSDRTLTLDTHHTYLNYMPWLSITTHTQPTLVVTAQSVPAPPVLEHGKSNTTSNTTTTTSTTNHSMAKHLTQRYGIKGIPTLNVLDGVTGEVISYNGKLDLANHITIHLSDNTTTTTTTMKHQVGNHFDNRRIVFLSLLLLLLLPQEEIIL